MKTRQLYAQAKANLLEKKNVFVDESFESYTSKLANIVVFFVRDKLAFKETPFIFSIYTVKETTYLGKTWQLKEEALNKCHWFKVYTKIDLWQCFISVCCVNHIIDIVSISHHELDIYRQRIFEGLNDWWVSQGYIKDSEW